MKKSFRIIRKVPLNDHLYDRQALCKKAEYLQKKSIKRAKVGFLQGSACFFAHRITTADLTKGIDPFRSRSPVGFLDDFDLVCICSRADGESKGVVDMHPAPSAFCGLPRGHGD